MKNTILSIFLGLLIFFFYSCEKNDNITDESTPMNVAPSDISLSDSVINENEPINTLIGVFTAYDNDSNDVHVFNLTSGDGDIDNKSFIISDNQLLSNEIFDFETKSNYSIRVKVIDQVDNVFEKQFSITVVDLGEC